jgi:hypothetical protein
LVGELEVFEGEVVKTIGMEAGLLKVGGVWAWGISVGPA